MKRAGVARALDRGMQRVAAMRTYTELAALSLVRSLRSVVSFRLPLSPFLVIGACFSAYTRGHVLPLLSGHSVG